MNTPKAWSITVATMVGGASLFVSDKFWTTTGPAHFTTQAEAIIGRPLTPFSVAGVARRTTRRAVAPGYYGYGYRSYGYGYGGYGYPYNYGYINYSSSYPYSNYGSSYPNNYGYTNYGSNYPYNNYGYANYGSTYPYNYRYGAIAGGAIAAARPWYGNGGYSYDYIPSYYESNPGYSTSNYSGIDYGASSYGYNPGYSTGNPTSGGQDAYCAQRFRSYDPGSGTYLGYDGQRHPCP